MTRSRKFFAPCVHSTETIYEVLICTGKEFVRVNYRNLFFFFELPIVFPTPIKCFDKNYFYSKLLSTFPN